MERDGISLEQINHLLTWQVHLRLSPQGIGMLVSISLLVSTVLRVDYVVIVIPSRLVLTRATGHHSIQNVFRSIFLHHPV